MVKMLIYIYIYMVNIYVVNTYLLIALRCRRRAAAPRRWAGSGRAPGGMDDGARGARRKAALPRQRRGQRGWPRQQGARGAVSQHAP